MSTASPVEIVWLVMAVLCLIVSSGNAREVRDDLEFWRSRPGPRDEAVGFDIKTDLAVEVLLIVAQVMFVVLGVFALVLPPRPDVAVRDAAAINTILAPLLVIVAEICLLLISIVRARSRWVQKQHGLRRAEDHVDDHEYDDDDPS
jgi:hypothetical protein